MMRPLDTIDAALDALRAGRPVLVVDDPGRENEGDVVLAAETVTDAWVGWAVRHTSGYLCAPMTAARADELDLPLMVPRTQDPLRTAYTVSVDAAAGVTTGISASDRARTLRVLANAASSPADLTRPGHVLPLRAREGGVLERRGHTEAGVDLCRLAGLSPVACIGELVHDAGAVMRLPDVLALGDAHDLPVISIADLVTWRERHDRVESMAVTTLPTEHGRFEARAYRDRVSGVEHFALVSPHGLGAAPLVRVHSECLTGDAFGSLRCDCGPQLRESMRLLGEQAGVVVYLRDHEGRGVGLGAKLAAYALQDGGLDTVDAQTALQLPVDAREYGAAAGMLHALGIAQVRLLTNNPDKTEALRRNGIDVVEQVPLDVGRGPDNERYLQTKRERLGHTLSADETARAERRSA